MAERHRDRHPIITGAEPWSFPGEGERARIGVIVVHGFTGNPISTRPLAEAMAEEGYRVELLRLPGHGTHWRDMMRTRYSDWRGVCEEALDKLGAECQKVFLAGISMGGTIVLDIAGRRQNDVAGVIPINASVLTREGIVSRLAPIISRVIPALPAKAAGLAKNDTTRPGVDEKAYSWIPMKAGNSVLVELPRIRSQLPGLSVPMLVVFSRLDGSVPPENSLAIPGLIGKPGKVEMLELENSRHLAILDVECDLLFERAAAFVAKIATQ